MSEDDLPRGWMSAHVSDIADVNPRPSFDLDDELEVGFIPMAAVDEYLGAITTFEIRRLGAVKRGYTPMQTGDVIFAKITPCMENGKAAIVCDLPSKTGYGSTEFFVLRPYQEIPPKWIHRFIRQEGFRRTAREHMAGAVGQARVPKSFLEETEIPIAPVAEQRRIVAKLDALQSRTRIAREALEAVAPLLKSFRQSVLQAAVTGALTEEWRSKQKKRPEWESVRIGDLLRDKPRNGYSPKSVDRETGVKSLSLSATTSGRFKPEYFKHIDESIPDDSYLWLQPGDILIQRANTIDYVGVSAIFDGPEKAFIYPDLMMKCRANSRTFPQYLHLLLSSNGVRQYYRENATGTAGNMPKINQETVTSAPADLPPLVEQTEIVRCVQHLFVMADAMEAEFAAAQRSVDQLDQSLLATAFRGELVPQDPSDEPASALLERIRAARAALPDAKAKRGRKPAIEPRIQASAESPKRRGRPRKA